MFAVLSRSFAGDVSRVVRKGGNNDLEVKKYRRRRVHRDENDASDSRRRFHVIADAVGRRVTLSTLADLTLLVPFVGSWLRICFVDETDNDMPILL